MTTNTTGLVLLLSGLAIIALTTIAPSVEGTFRSMIVRGVGANNGQIYSGSGVGPLHLFRSSSYNAAAVTNGLKNRPLQKTFALAFGDEFPQARDDLIKWNLNRGAHGTRTVATAGAAGAQGARPSLANVAQWRFDRNNAQKENHSPYVRHNAHAHQTAVKYGPAVGGHGASFSAVKTVQVGSVAAPAPVVPQKIHVNVVTQAPARAARHF